LKNVAAKENYRSNPTQKDMKLSGTLEEDQKTTSNASPGLQGPGV
jgi:hypothetical protein